MILGNVFGAFALGSRITVCVAVAVALRSRNGGVALAVAVAVRPPSQRGFSRGLSRFAGIARCDFGGYRGVLA